MNSILQVIISKVKLFRKLLCPAAVTLHSSSARQQLSRLHRTVATGLPLELPTYNMIHIVRVTNYKNNWMIKNVQIENRLTRIGSLYMYQIVCVSLLRYGVRVSVFVLTCAWVTASWLKVAVLSSRLSVSYRSIYIRVLQKKCILYVGEILYSSI